MDESGYQALRGQIAVLVGGLGPAGRSAARRLAAEGAIVILCDLNDSETAAAADELAADNLPVQGIGIDVTSAESVAAAFDLIGQTYGDPTLLCYGVGFHLDTLVGETATDLWRHGLLSNLDGAWLCAREFVRRLMPQRHGQFTVAFLASDLGGADDDALTSLTKAAIGALAHTLEREYASRGLRAALLLSGPLPGSGGERVFRQAVERRGTPWETFLRSWDAGPGARRTRNPDDVAQALVQLVSGAIPPSPHTAYSVAPGGIVMDASIIHP